MTPRLCLLPVFRQEAWPSIDLCAEMLRQYFPSGDDSEIHAEMVTPSYSPCPGLSERFRQRRATRKLERLWNRFVCYPRQAKRLRSNYDLFHVCDHSYSQLVHAVPNGRSGLLCQDLDTFRCLLEPQVEPRSWAFRLMTRRILSGFQKAAVVFYTTEHVRSQIEKYQLVDPARLVHAPLGIAAEFLQDHAQSQLPEGVRQPYLLHVGSCIPRKRIDVLLKVFHGVRQQRPDVQLVKVGGPFDVSQEQMIRDLGLRDGIVTLSGLSRETLAGLYRQSAVTLVPSEREGFGLPVIEALACGSPVLANDIPPLREGGGKAATYLPISDIASWVEQTLRCLSQPDSIVPVEIRRQQGRAFRWERHAQAIHDAYLALWDRIQAAEKPTDLPAKASV
ncbi:glycosyltransferase [bacterium]|nr:glycosyltransferase [bacterium]